MNVIEVLKSDHAAVEALFTEILSTTSANRQRREDLFRELKTALLQHGHAEEKVFYPPLHQRQSTHDAIEHGVGEHHVVEALLKKLEGLPADSDEWMDSIEDIHGKICDHVQEEEDDVFPKAEKLLSGDELNRMTEAFITAKAQEGKAQEGSVS